MYKCVGNGLLARPLTFPDLIAIEPRVSAAGQVLLISHQSCAEGAPTSLGQLRMLCSDVRAFYLKISSAGAPYAYCSLGAKGCFRQLQPLYIS